MTSTELAEEKPFFPLDSFVKIVFRLDELDLERDAATFCLSSESHDQELLEKALGPDFSQPHFFRIKVNDLSSILGVPIVRDERLPFGVLGFKVQGKWARFFPLGENFTLSASILNEAEGLVRMEIAPS